MRLLDTTTGEFHWVNNPREVRYAALSHVWSKQESDGENYVPEQTYQEVLKIQRSAKAKDEVPLTRLSEKIRMACEIARTHGFEYIWIDSCCIDQSSSAELSEAINSMYEWYSCSNLCYAYLKDVTVKEEPGAHHADFPRSEWFRRGWTLQELIAPQNVLFLSDDWNDIGTKHSLAATIANVTKIDIEVLKHDKTPAAVPVAERMAWASSRVTTKEEDKAYCLVGLFGANITPMYGEGQNAFRRLQEAILRHEPDQSIFVWGSCIPASLLSHLSTDCKFDPRTPTSYLLAPSPNSYQASQRRTPDRPTITTPRFISTIPRTELAYKLRLPSLDHPHYTITSSGIRTKLPILRYQYQHATGNTIVYLLAILACADGDGSLLALLLHPVERQDSGMQHDSAQTATPIPDSVMFVGAPAVGEVATGTCCRLVALPNQTLHDCMSNSTIEEKEVYIKHCPDLFMREDYRGTSRAGIALVYDIDESPFEVKLSQWSQHILTTRQGYFVDTQHKGGSQRHYDIELKKGHDYILVTFERCLVCTTDVPIFSSGSSSKPQWPFRVVVKERLNSDTTGADCNLEHIDKWKIQNGIASTSFKLRQRSDGQVRYLRISLSLRKPPAAGEGRVYHGYQHIMDIELLMHPPPRSETSSRTVDRVQSETRTVTLPHRPDYPNITQTVPFDYMPSPISSIDGPQSFPFADSGRPQPTTNLPPMNGWQQQYQIGPEYGGGPVRHDTLHVRGRSTLPAPRHTSSQLRTGECLITLYDPSSSR
ncbi:heterokaryon incompatibility protein-domain-containing protein [Daedaleopsis nitida]|nr:heterokaryon incompatibility protein-domain-containing protein [Daedaleopsis nitida]